MFPIMLDVSQLNILLVGNGKQTARRLSLLLESGEIKCLKVYSEQPSKELEAKAGDYLVRGLPSEDEIRAFQVVMIVDIEEKKAADLANVARKHHILTNVEDRRPYCDFFFASLVRRGDLLLTVSTSGKSPTLAVKIKDLLSRAFTEDWVEKLRDIGNRREEWKKQGLGYHEVKEQTEQFLEQEEWLGDNVCPRHRNTKG